MKAFDHTKRCQNCGGLRKEHHVRKPYRCPTRLKESYWLPWTQEAYDVAEKAGRAAAAITVTTRLGIVEDNARAGALFNAILRGVQMANARVAREKEEADRKRGEQQS